MIECLPPFREAGTPPKYPAITYGEYAELRYRQAHGDGKRLNLASDAPSPGANSLPFPDSLSVLQQARLPE